MSKGVAKQRAVQTNTTREEILAMAKVAKALARRSSDLTDKRLRLITG